MKKMGKRERAAREEYGRSRVAYERMSRAIDGYVQQLYYALQRRDQAELRFRKADSRLTKFTS